MEIKSPQQKTPEKSRKILSQKVSSPTYSKLNVIKCVKAEF
jgi:hypothetical protein